MSRTRASDEVEIEIVICARHFPPAYRSGGPPRSLGGLVKVLREEFTFRVLTMANDRTDRKAMPGVVPNTWSSWGPAKVRYGTNPWRVAIEVALSCRAAGPPRVIYLNSFFDIHFTLLPLVAMRLIASKTPVVLAPRGEFSPGALSLKPRKKAAYQALLRRSGLLQNVRWQASTGDELADIKRQVGPSAQVVIARNLREVPDLPVQIDVRPRAGTFRIAHLSRITRMKNLGGLIRALGLCQSGDFQLTIAGPVVEEGYWSDCRRLIAELDLGSRTHYVGEVEPETVIPFLSDFDLFALPTLGENFGHVVLEALLAGTPVLVSDRTPWGAVADRGAGAVVDIRDPRTIADAIDRIAALTPSDHQTMREQARALGQSSLDNAEVIASNVHLFRSALAAPT